VFAQFFSLSKSQAGPQHHHQPVVVATSRRNTWHNSSDSLHKVHMGHQQLLMRRQ
jgi:hypothetical protein